MRGSFPSPFNVHVARELFAHSFPLHPNSLTGGLIEDVTRLLNETIGDDIEGLKGSQFHELEPGFGHSEWRARERKFGRGAVIEHRVGGERRRDAGGPPNWLTWLEVKDLESAEMILAMRWKLWEKPTEPTEVELLQARVKDLDDRLFACSKAHGELKERLEFYEPPPIPPLRRVYEDEGDMLVSLARRDKIINMHAAKNQRQAKGMD